MAFGDLTVTGWVGDSWSPWCGYNGSPNHDLGATEPRSPVSVDPWTLTMWWYLAHNVLHPCLSPALLAIFSSIPHHFLHLCSTFSPSLLIIFSTFAHHFLHPCSQFYPPLLTIFSTLLSIFSTRAHHFIHHCSTFSPTLLTIFSNLAQHFLQPCSPFFPPSTIAQHFLQPCSPFSLPMLI